MRSILEYLINNHINHKDNIDLSNFNKNNPLIYTLDNGHKITIKVYKDSTLSILNKKHILENMIDYIIRLCNACGDELTYEYCMIYTGGKDNFMCVFGPAWPGESLYYYYDNKVIVYYDQSSSDKTETMYINDKFTSKFKKAFCKHNTR